VRLFESLTIVRVAECEEVERSKLERVLMKAQADEIAASIGLEGGAPLAAGEWEIAPWARPELVAGVGETWRPILHRQPLSLPANK
jgi:hypothetical protein